MKSLSARCREASDSESSGVAQTKLVAPSRMIMKLQLGSLVAALLVLELAGAEAFFTAP